MPVPSIFIPSPDTFASCIAHCSAAASNTPYCFNRYQLSQVPAFLGYKTAQAASLAGVIVCLATLVVYCVFQVPAQKPVLIAHGCWCLLCNVYLLHCISRGRKRQGSQTGFRVALYAWFHAIACWFWFIST